jgi:CheY-like chemotaxis protein
MNGPDAARAIRGFECDVFIVAITGNMLQEDVQLFLSCGANVVLPKPLKMPQLEQVLTENHIVGYQKTDPQFASPV